MYYDSIITEHLQKIEATIPDKDHLSISVSKAPVAWHLDHSLKVINSICDALVKSDPKAYKKSFSILRLYCFTLGYIPRGKGKAPKSVLPPDIIQAENLIAQLQITKNKLRTLSPLHDNAFIHHPYFKQLNKAQSIRFIEIHTRHHLKIIADILKQ